MAPHPDIDMEAYTYADVDKEYDFEAEIERAKEHLMQKERLEEECKRLELELKMREIESQRSLFADEDRLIERVMHLFRGRRISQRTFDIILREIRYCVHPEMDDYFYMRQQEEVRRMVSEYRKMAMLPKYVFRWDSDGNITREEKQKDFIEEDDMKL